MSQVKTLEDVETLRRGIVCAATIERSVEVGADELRPDDLSLALLGFDVFNQACLSALQSIRTLPRDGADDAREWRAMVAGTLAACGRGRGARPFVCLTVRDVKAFAIAHAYVLGALREAVLAVADG